MASSPSEIVLKSYGYTIEVKQVDGKGASSAIVQSSHIVKRHCETRVEALQDCAGGRLSRLHRLILHLEQVGMSPAAYGAVKGKPSRALAGAALVHWIAAQAELPVSSVRDLLTEAESILGRQALE